MSISINGSGAITFNDGSTQNTASLPGMRNRIINGAMMIDQRNNGSSISINGTTGFPVDRFKVTAGGGGVISASRSTTAPTGFINSLSNTVSTADSSIASSDIYVIDCFNEGLNTADLAFGTASASAVTLSFWVRSSVTGTYGVRISNGSFSRCYVSTYTISAANTWEQKTVTIAGDTTGTWATDNSTGIAVSWDLGSGTNWNGTANAWQTGNFLRTSGCVNWIATAGATFQITGVQLEKGSTATSFDYRPYGTELQLCERYYQRLGGVSYAVLGSGIVDNARTTSRFYIKFNVSFRANPTASISNLISTDRETYDANLTSISAQTTCSDSMYLAASHSASGRSYYPTLLAVQNSTTGYLALDAEL